MRPDLNVACQCSVQLAFSREKQKRITPRVLALRPDPTSLFVCFLRDNPVSCLPTAETWPDLGKIWDMLSSVEIDLARVASLCCVLFIRQPAMTRRIVTRNSTIPKRKMAYVRMFARAYVHIYVRVPYAFGIYYGTHKACECLHAIAFWCGIMCSSCPPLPRFLPLELIEFACKCKCTGICFRASRLISRELRLCAAFCSSGSPL